MDWRRSLLLTVCALLVANASARSILSSGGNATDPDAYDHKLPFIDAMAGTIVAWTVDQKTQNMTFMITGKSNGWLGMGLSPNGAMSGADIVVMWIDSNGQSHISDRHGPTDMTNGYPPHDEQQDYSLVSAARDGDTLTFVVTRASDTCDEYDWAVGPDTIHLLVAASDTLPSSADDISKHDRKEIISTRWLTPDNTEHTQQVLHAPGVTAFNFYANNVHVDPSTETLYQCVLYEVPKMAPGSQFIGYEMAVQPGQVGHVHHMLMYGCKGNLSQYMNTPYQSMSCDDDASSVVRQHCLEGFVAWAVGAPPFAYPDNMAMGWFQEEYPYMLASYHYNNPNGDNFTDNSSIIFYATETPRDIAVGKLIIGTDASDEDIVIPPNVTRFTQTTWCPSQCTQNMNGSVHVISGLLHSHLTGVEIKVRHVRNGIELPPILWDKSYDFNYQKPMIRFDDPVEIQPGDDVIVECTYDTVNRTTMTLGGESTHQEMCMAIMDVYPRLMDLGARCFSHMQPFLMVPALGGRLFYDDGNGNEIVIDKDGNYVDFHPWLESLDWHKDNNSLTRTLETFTRGSPVMAECEILSDKAAAYPNVPADPFYMMANPTPISQKYVEPPNPKCQGKVKPHSGAASVGVGSTLLAALALLVAKL